MKKEILIIISSICLLLWPSAVFAGRMSGTEPVSVRDSLCHNPLLLYFRFDRSLVEYDYMDNPHTLQRFQILFADSIASSRIDTITITSYASPEGNSRYNYRLAHHRAVAVKGYLIWKYPHLDQHRILICPQGEDWAGLRQLVEADPNVPDREEVLEILNKVTDTEHCKSLLRRLNCGYAYRYINKYLLPELRNAAVCTVRMRKGGLPVQAVSYEQANDYSLLRASQSTICRGESSLVRPHRPVAIYAPDFSYNPIHRPSSVLFSLKTNLLSWAGIIPEGKMASFRPNLALELFFARRWSLSASGEYSHWQGGTDSEFWGISGYSLEPRLWLLGDGTYRWLFLGAYGQLGDFDYQPCPDGDTGRTGTSITGTYWSAGLVLGLYLRLSRHWGVEASVRGGYRDASGKAYDYEPPHAYYHKDAPSDRWGVTGLNFSLTYRWWNKTARR